MAVGDSLVDVVLESEPSGRGYEDPRGGPRFHVGVPVKVPRALAEQLVGNNPEPWQGDGHSVYRIVTDEKPGKGGKG